MSLIDKIKKATSKLPRAKLSSLAVEMLKTYNVNACGSIISLSMSDRLFEGLSEMEIASKKRILAAEASIYREYLKEYGLWPKEYERAYQKAIKGPLSSKDIKGLYQ